MRIALISDVHANLPALEAALEAAQRHGAEAVLVAGDVVGSGPHPAEVIEALADHRVAGVRGNVDRKVLTLAEHPARLREIIAEGRRKSNYAWTALQLKRSALGWLAALPASLTYTVGGLEVLVVHGSPGDDTDYLYPSLTSVGLAHRVRGAPAPAVLVCGHSHIPFARRIGGTLVVNCGSVGRPVDGDPRGSLALLEVTGAGRLRARIMRIAYEVERTVAALGERRVPGAVPAEYVRGVKRDGA